MVRRRKQRDDDASLDDAAPASPKGQRLTPVEVQQKVFRLSFRGYNERDVDEFLDRVTEDLAALHEENKRLRESLQDAGGAPAALGGSQRQAEQIVREAREHAARLVEDAERRAGEIRSDAVSAAPASAGASADLPSSFLTKEREFLRRLASMVQEHARSLKKEASRTRAAPTIGAGAETPSAEPAPEASALAMAQRAIETEPEPPPTTAMPSAAEVAAERIPGEAERTPPGEAERTPPGEAESAAPPAATPAGPIATPAPPPAQAPSTSTEGDREGTEAEPSSLGEERSGPWGPATREPAAEPVTAPWGAEERGERPEESDPLISAWESAFVGGGPETGDETPRTQRPAEGDEGDAPEEKGADKRDDEPSLKELFWGEQ